MNGGVNVSLDFSTSDNRMTTVEGFLCEDRFGESEGRGISNNVTHRKVRVTEINLGILFAKANSLINLHKYLEWIFWHSFAFPIFPLRYPNGFFYVDANF